MAVYNGTNTGAEVDAAVDAVQLAKAATSKDPTVGRLLKLGDFGVGSTTTNYTLTDTEGVDIDTFCRANSATTVNLPRPSNSFNMINMAASPATNTAIAISWANVDSQVLAYIRSQSSTYSNWLELAHEGNNALIEFGSNANGSYTKFPDGTLICRNSLTSSASTETTWTFPSTFSSIPLLQLTAISGVVSALSPRYSTSTTTNSSFSVMNTANARTSQAVSIFAIGRWK